MGPTHAESRLPIWFRFSGAMCTSHPVHAKQCQEEVGIFLDVWLKETVDPELMHQICVVRDADVVSAAKDGAVLLLCPVTFRAVPEPPPFIYNCCITNVRFLFY